MLELRSSSSIHASEQVIRPLIRATVYLWWIALKNRTSLTVDSSALLEVSSVPSLDIKSDIRDTRDTFHTRREVIQARRLQCIKRQLILAQSVVFKGSIS
jgi:hypothetical protein